MGKDYSLAIIIVNCDDNLWTDQNLQSDPDLPSGWRTITDSTGTYYWHVSSGATQWERPRNTANGPKLKLQEETQSPNEKPEEGFHGTSWHEDYLPHHDPESKIFSVRALGWMQVLEEDLGPGRSSLAVSHVIQQLSHSQSQDQTRTQARTQSRTQTRTSGSSQQNQAQNRLNSQDHDQDPAQPLEACGEGQEMKLVLKKDCLMLLDPLDHTPLHCQPISNIRVWGVGCNNGRDFAFVAGDKDSCILKCHVFRCDVPAKTIATALHQLCSKMMSEKSARPTRSLTMESISPEDFPRQGTAQK